MVNTTPYKSGFVNIIGRPNVGKSTLMNAMLGERLSIITAKPQTTRHRIIGIISAENYQIVLSDLPGVVQNPVYKLHEKMNRFVAEAFEDADIMIFATEPADKFEEDLPIFKKIARLECPVFVILNKKDTIDEARIEELRTEWAGRIAYKEFMAISALNKEGLDELHELILKYLPEGPPYYDPENLTDKPERFFVSEIVREHILLNYREEIPYSVEVAVESFKDDPEKPLARIRVLIYTERESQKNIIIGAGGKSIKKVGVDARKDIEKFLDKQVFLELFVKVRPNWRNEDKWLDRFGYQ